MDSEIIQQFYSFFEQWKFIAPERFINAALALLLTIIVGIVTGPRANSAAPLFWRGIDSTFGKIGSRLDKRNRHAGDLILRGFFVVTVMILFVGALGIYAEENLNILYQPRLIEILLLSFCMSSGAIWIHIIHIYRLSKNPKAAGQGHYLILARSSRIDLSARDDFTITRTGAELLVRFFDKAAVSPALWYAFGGLPAVFIYSALAAYAWKNGYDGSVNGTGSVGLALEKLMGFVPSVFAASLLAMTTTVVPTSGPFSGLKPLRNVQLSLPFEQGGQPMSVLAYALHITIGGPVMHINGHSVKRQWTGPDGATARLDFGHLKRILYMIIVAHIFLLAALFGASLYA